jgi:hypothetical protein
MCRYSLTVLTTRPLHYLDWNAYHSAFAVHACNLAAFLTNTDTGNFKAQDFVQNHKSRKGDLAGIFQKMEPQIFHLGKARPTDEGKFNIEEAKQIAAWIEAEMKVFLKDENVRGLWNEQRSWPEALTLNLPAQNQTASSADPQTTTTTLVFGRSPK